MSIAKTGALQDSYKYVNIAIDSFDGRLLQGRRQYPLAVFRRWPFAWKTFFMSSAIP